MKTNMGLADRVIRFIIAVTIISLYYTGVISGTVGLVLIALSAVFLLTSLVAVCPLYLPFGINTQRKTTAGNRSEN